MIVAGENKELTVAHVEGSRVCSRGLNAMQSAVCETDAHRMTVLICRQALSCRGVKLSD